MAKDIILVEGKTDSKVFKAIFQHLVNKSIIIAPIPEIEIMGGADLSNKDKPTALANHIRDRYRLLDDNNKFGLVLDLDTYSD